MDMPQPLPYSDNFLNPLRVSEKPFPTTTSGLLAWDMEVPSLSTPYNIESTLLPNGYHSTGDSSTALPSHPGEQSVYPGVTLAPIEITSESLPSVAPIDFRDCIYCFPAETGLPPIYIVFNRPYGGTTKGAHSGRWYDPEKAGGPTLELDWRDATITRQGIDLVKLHTARFGTSSANKVMIGRLEKILGGERIIETIDKLFYTHEIRELERYRALGVPDSTLVLDEGVTWNNTHTATLEDFRLKDSMSQFYTKEALSADAENY